MHKIDKAMLKDKMGRPLTQSLFLEIGYNTEFAVYTLEEDDKMYKGKLYPSLKKAFLDEEDVTEYLFAKKYLLGWKHWQRLNANKILSKHFDEWRTELELQTKALGIKGIIDQASGDNAFGANKWLAEKGWIEKRAGRPSKQQIEQNINEERRLLEEFEEDLDRLRDFTVVEGGK